MLLVICVMKKLYLLFAFIILIIGGCSVLRNHIIKNKRNAFVHLVAVSEVAPGFALPMSMASGFIVANEGYRSVVLTAAHFCLKNMNVEEVSFHDDFFITTIDERRVNGRIIAIDPTIDVCLLETPHIGLGSVKFSSYPPEITDEVINIGAPAGMVDKDMVMIYEGRYMGEKSNCATSKKCAIYNIPAYPGSSGSFILNSNGRLIGMVSATIGGFFHMAMSPTWEQMIKFVEKAIDLPYVINNN